MTSRRGRSTNHSRQRAEALPRDNMMQAPAMMTTGGTWMAYTDRDGRPCWHNPATNEWTYNLGGGSVMMGVPQPQVVGYVPAPAAPVGMYGWQTAAPAATVPAPGAIFYGPPGAAVMPAAAGPYGPAAAQQMMYAQHMQQMQQQQQQQQQGMMAAAAYQQQQQHLQLQRSASDGGMFGGPPALQRSGSDGSMFGGHPSMMGAGAGSAAAGAAGMAGYSMMPDPNGPDAAAWLGPGPPDGSRPFPKSHKARGSIPMPPFDPSHMHLPAWFAGGAGAAAAGDAAGGPGGISGFFGGIFPPGMTPPGVKGKKGKKGKKKDGEGEGEEGAEGKEDSGEQNKAPAATAVSDDDGNASAAAAAADSDSDGDDDGDGGDVAKEVMASSAAAAAAAAGIAAAVARSDKESASPQGDELDQREPGGDGDGNEEQAGAGEAAKGVWVRYYDRGGGQWWRNTVTGARLNQDPYV